MRRERYNRLLSLTLAVVLLVISLPVTVADAAAPFRSGDRVVIYAPDFSRALSARVENGYQAGVSVSVAHGVVTGYSETEIWTVTGHSDGSWSFANGGQTLGMGEEYQKPELGAVYDRWVLTNLGGGYYVTNQARNSCLTWYSARGNFISYDAAQAEGMAQAKLAFYVIPAQPQETQPPEETTAPTDATTAPTEETTAPTEQTAAPTESTTAPTEATTAPTEETTAPTEAPTEPIQPPTEASTEAPAGPTESRPAFSAGGYRLYFGQLHAHTADSDGTGTVAEAYAHAAKVPWLDFLAITEHSNSFDNNEAGALNQNGGDISTEWANGRAAAAAVTNGYFVGIYGFEFSPNQGQGHISTFNTPGWLSRNQDAHKSYANGLENYYQALLAAPGSVSQFNHPGTMYGDFKNFASHSPQLDDRITLLEVGSGAGGEYTAAYDYYTRALDKGWHLAPTNNQNNHNGRWGDANSARTVVLAGSLTETGIYDALGNCRAYATEDRDLHIYYTLNGKVMGSRITDAEETVDISASLLDPSDASVGTVEVIVDGGEVAVSRQVDGASGTVQVSLSSEYSYYYLRITQPDGDTAVTAPVWVEQSPKLGISRLETKTQVTIAGEEQTILLALYNSENEDMKISSIVFADKKTGKQLHEETSVTAVEALKTAACSFPHTFENEGTHTVTVTVKGSFAGRERVYTKELAITVLPRTVSGDIVVDGTHGNLGIDELTNFASLAGAKNLRVHIEKEEITESMLADCGLLIISGPSKALEDVFLKTVADYVKDGGDLILCGASGGSSELNRLLRAVGASMHLGSDEVRDDVSNGGKANQLYTNVFNESAPQMDGLIHGQIYRHIAGCTVDPGKGTWLVKGLRTAYSSGGEDTVLLSAEQTPYEGVIVLAGSLFLNDESLAAPGNAWAIPYANRVLCENLLGTTRTQPVITPIGQVRSAQPGQIFLVEGRVTSGTINPNTTFPDTIYLQDDTGGIAARAYSARGLELGRRVRILGELETVGENRQLRILSMEILEKGEMILPKAVSNQEAMDYGSYGGRLLQIHGFVEERSLTADGEGVAFFTVDDGITPAAVRIESSIRSGSTGKNELASLLQVGTEVQVTGICHREDGQTVLRVRDCDEVVIIPPPEENEPTETDAPTQKANKTSKKNKVKQTKTGAEGTAGAEEPDDTLNISLESREGALLWIVILLICVVILVWILLRLIRKDKKKGL